MKKFLTVLLALSVVFTYSFGTVGSVFAASTSETEFDILVEQAADQVRATTNTAYTEAVKALPDEDPGLATSVDVDAQIWKDNASVYGDKINDLISAKMAEIKSLYDTEANQSTLNDWELSDAVAAFSVAAGEPYISGVNATAEAIPTTVTDVTAAIQGDDDVKLAVAKAYGAGLAEDAIIALRGIDLTVYSNTVNTETNMSSAAMASAVVQNAISDIQKLDFASAEQISDVNPLLTSLGAFKTAELDAVTGDIDNEDGGSGILGKFVHATDSTYNQEKYVIASGTQYEGQDLVTKEDEEADANTLEALKASYLAKVESNYAAYIASNNTTAGRAEAAAYREGVREIINAAETLADLRAIFADANAIPTPDGTYVADKEAIDALVVLANKYIAEGYDADEINDIVAGAKVQAYSATGAWDGTYDGTKNAEDAIKAAVAAQFDTKKIDKEVADLELALEAILEADNYYAPEAAEVTALYNQIIAEIKACASDDDIAKVKTNYNSTANWNNPKGLSDIATKADVVAAIKKTTTGDTGWNNNMAAVSAYGQYLNAGLTSTSDQYRDFVAAGMFTNATTVDADWLADFYAENGARTTAEAYAMIASARAALEAVKTVSAVNAAAAVIEAQIAALPAATTITANDAAAVEAVKEAYDKFVEETGSDISATSKLLLTRAITAAGNATRLALLQELNSYVSQTVTAADKAALEDLQARVDAYNEKCEVGGVYSGFTQITSMTAKAKLAEIRNAAKSEVQKAIAALPLTITEDSIAQVEAAKQLYDDYVATYTDFYTPLADKYNPTTGFNQNAADDFTAAETKELNDAVKVAGEISDRLAAEEIEKTKLAVQGTHVKIWSSSGSGYIRIRWDQNDNGVTLDGYEVYRSTKKTTGFSKISTFKVQKQKTYKINMKKGTKYYFKVKGYKMVGDEKVYTHDSITVYRTFR